MTNEHPHIGDRLTTAEQLDELPPGSWIGIVRNGQFRPFECFGDEKSREWLSHPEGTLLDVDWLPATVLYAPTQVDVHNSVRWPGIGKDTADTRRKWAADHEVTGRADSADGVHGECGQPWTVHEDDGVQMLCPDPVQVARVKDAFGAAVQVINRHVRSEDTAIAIASELNGKRLLGTASTVPTHAEIARAILLVRLAERGIPAAHVDDPDLLATVKPMADAVRALWPDLAPDAAGRVVR